METADPSEYTFALRYLDGWNHWEKLSKTRWFRPYVLKWRQELDLKIKAEALRRIISESKSNSKSSFQANKFLVEKGWGEFITGDKKRGRPSNLELESALKKELDLERQITQDFERIQSLPDKGPKEVWPNAQKQ